MTSSIQVSEEMLNAGQERACELRNVTYFDDELQAEIYLAMKAAEPLPQGDEVERDISGETVCGFRVAAWRETHPEHGDKYGHSYSEHWSTPSNRDPRVKVERLFTEDQLRAALVRSKLPDEMSLCSHAGTCEQNAVEFDGAFCATPPIGDDVRERFASLESDLVMLHRATREADPHRELTIRVEDALAELRAIMAPITAIGSQSIEGERA